MPEDGIYRLILYSIKKYLWHDDVALTETSYYRIKAVDKSGKANYSNTLKATVNENQSFINIFPNPVIGNKLQIEMYNNKNGKYQLGIFNTAGRLLFQQILFVTIGKVNQPIFLPSNLVSGNYWFTIQSATTKTIYRKLIFVQ